MCDDPVEIPDEKLPELAAIYENHIKWAPHVISFIKMAIKWKQSEESAKHIKFLTLSNDNNNGTFIATITGFTNDLFVFTLENSCETLYKILTTTDSIDFLKKTTIYNVHERHMPTIRKFLNEKKIDIISDERDLSIFYAITPDQALNFSITIPDDVFIEKLDFTRHVSEINSLWPHKSHDSERYLETLIKLNGGYGVFLKSNNQLVSWVIRQYFDQIGVLQTLEHYKNLGFARLLLKFTSQKIAEENLWPVAAVRELNQPSRNLFESLGFVNVGYNIQLTVQKKK